MTGQPSSKCCKEGREKLSTIKRWEGNEELVVNDLERKTDE